MIENKLCLHTTDLIFIYNLTREVNMEKLLQQMISEVSTDVIKCDLDNFHPYVYVDTGEVESKYPELWKKLEGEDYYEVFEGFINHHQNC